MEKNGNRMASSGRIPRPQNCKIECKIELKDGRTIVLETPDTLKQIEADRPEVPTIQSESRRFFMPEWRQKKEEMNNVFAKANLHKCKK